MMRALVYLELGRSPRRGLPPNACSANGRCWRVKLLAVCLHLTRHHLTTQRQQKSRLFLPTAVRCQGRPRSVTVAAWRVGVWVSYAQMCDGDDRGWTAIPRCRVHVHARARTHPVPLRTESPWPQASSASADNPPRPSTTTQDLVARHKQGNQAAGSSRFGDTRSRLKKK